MENHEERRHRVALEWAEKEGVSKELIAMMELLTPEQRSALTHAYCHSCGNKDPGCQCWNDE